MSAPRYSRPRKRSLVLSGHATSVSLEDDFWDAFRAIAARRGLSPASLAAEIDRARGRDSGLASAIRLFVLAACRTGEDIGKART